MARVVQYGPELLPIMRLAAAILVSAGLTGCSHLPVAPATLPLSQRQVKLALVGQSNARLSRPVFAQHPDISLVPIQLNCPTIADWAEDGSCWPSLQKDIHNQPMDAFVFWQGASDITNPHYYAALSDLIRRIRIEVGNPKLLIVLMQYGRAYSGFSVEGGSEPASIAFVAHDPHSIYVPTHDLEWLPDNGHMTEAGYAAVVRRIVAMVRQKLLSESAGATWA